MNDDTTKYEDFHLEKTPGKENILEEIVLDSKAYHGLVGQFVREIESRTEADPAAILFQCLVATGCYLGETFYRFAGDQQRSKLFLVAVGNSAKARKGTSWAVVHGLQNAIDANFVNNQIVNGMGSGESIIGKLKDPDVASPHSHDPRLLISGGEFAQILQVMNRDGSILSSIIRDGWDNRPLMNMVKSGLIKVSKHHISIIAHITQEELARLMKDQDRYNGFANRFIFIWSRRSKLLPFPEEIPDEIFAAYGNKIRDNINALRKRSVSELKFSPSASSKWAEIYPELSRDRYGVVGSVLSRAEAQVTRLALVYAVIDGSEWIELMHLEAALALWDFVEQSTERIFGALNATTSENKIKAVLRDCKSLVRSEVHSLLGNNLGKQEIDGLRDSLVNERVIRVRQQTNLKGRPSEVWELC